MSTPNPATCSRWWAATATSWTSSPPTRELSVTTRRASYQDLVTRYEGGAGAGGSGCASCAYDAMGNPLAVTDPRGFTTRYDRNELGEVYRTISPQPYNFRVETYFDANRNVTRVDTEDLQPAFDSADPSSAVFAQFTPSGSGSHGPRADAARPRRQRPAGLVHQPLQLRSLGQQDRRGHRRHRLHAGQSGDDVPLRSQSEPDPDHQARRATSSSTITTSGTCGSPPAWAATCRLSPPEPAR